MTQCGSSNAMMGFPFSDGGSGVAGGMNVYYNSGGSTTSTSQMQLQQQQGQQQGQQQHQVALVAGNATHNPQLQQQLQVQQQPESRVTSTVDTTIIPTSSTVYPELSSTVITSVIPNTTQQSHIIPITTSSNSTTPNLQSINPAIVSLANTGNVANVLAAGQAGYQPQPFGPTVPSSSNITTTSTEQMLTTIPEYTLPTAPLHTVQDLPMTVTPIFNGVNQNYPGLQVINQNPPVFLVQNFLTKAECDFLICVAQDCFTSSNVVGEGSGVVSPSRTSSTCYLAREDLPEYLKKVSLLTGKPVEHCELPQVGRYYNTQQYLQHFDAFDLSNEHGRRFADNGGQRTVTVLVYLNDVERGGSTFFPALNLDVQPKKGTALIFFPATVDGYLDQRALHCAKPAIDTKYVSQVWIRQSNYSGIPSKRMFSSVDQASLVQKSLIAASAGFNNPDMVIQNSNVLAGVGAEDSAYLRNYQSQQQQRQ